ncbi:MAG: 3-hydroxyacyl-CoA dehydrogenase/enoyl-CoA hydratase family protein [Flavobacteriaceae bacterium]
MNYRLKKVAVLGSGIMGSGIACHLANVGMEVVMLDIVTPDLNDEKSKSTVERNKLVNSALQKTIKSKPAPLYHKSFASRIKTGNFEDDFQKIAESDWIIEVVVENLKIKKQIFEKVDKYRKKGSLVSSNTSSIPINLLAQDRSDDFKKSFCGTHFFNPARYLRLLEIIPTNDTLQGVTDFFMEFGKVILGKQTVLCKDTPAFIGNRIGVMSATEMTLLTEKYNFGIEEVDAMTGSLIGRPSTATFRLQDLVGLDTGDNVSRFVAENVKNDNYIDRLKDRPEPKFMKFLLKNKFLGNKTGKGFYEKTSKRDKNGKSIINALNIKTLKYEPAIRPKIDFIKAAKGIGLMNKRLQYIVEGDTIYSQFFAEYFGQLFSYAAARVPEISDQYFPIDDAMRTGYFWDFGPFEYWDLIGFELGITLIEKVGAEVPQWITKMAASGKKHFYKFEDGKKKYYNISSNDYVVIPGMESFLILDSFRSQTPLIKNSESVVHDIGDGVLCFEFTGKSNSIGQGVGEALIEALKIAEEENWKGIVIGNNAKQFSVGANLMEIGMVAMQKQFDQLERFVDNFQQINMKIRTSKIPIVVATQGYVFGGGCEIAMHCDGGIYASESYIGLVEVGVGLLPGGGGTKEFALRASDDFFDGDVQSPTLINYFKSIATAAVSTSAYEAFDLNYLKKGRDEVCINTNLNIGLAKEKVLELAKNYIPPSARDDIQVLGRSGMGVLYSAINEFRMGEYMSDYDVEIARKIAYVLCGGDLTSSQQVSEQYLLDIEREGFMSLLGNQKTLDRIQYLLMNNKPLRN